MLLNFFSLSISIVVGIASANPATNVAIPSKSFSDVIDYSTDLVIRENPYPLFLQNFGALTGYQRSALPTTVDIIYWLASNVAYIITAAVISFCRLSNLCMGLEKYLPIFTNTVTQALIPENFETAERVLVTAMGNYFEGRK